MKGETELKSSNFSSFNIMSYFIHIDLISYSSLLDPQLLILDQSLSTLVHTTHNVRKICN